MIKVVVWIFDGYFYSASFTTGKMSARKLDMKLNHFNSTKLQRMTESASLTDLLRC